MKTRYFATSQTAAPIPITLVSKSTYPEWLDKQPDTLKKQLHASKFKVKSGHFFLHFAADGSLLGVIVGLDHPEDFWALAALSQKLPEGLYQITPELSPHLQSQAYLAWGLGYYEFTRYVSKTSDHPAQLLVPETIDLEPIESLIQTIFWIRDLINTPNQDLGPEELASEAASLAKQFDATIQVTLENLSEQYPAIYAVGKGSNRAPRLIDLRWGNLQQPKVTLVGKGVCFDSGGYDIKPASAMLTMKKDMGGAAHVLGLAKLIMTAKLPICLRVLIPAVENRISEQAYLPGDVIQSRKGTTIEITNTDAEGRVILCDALYEASQEQPDLLIDFATLTGAAIIALGGEVGAFFTNRPDIANALMKHSKALQDPLWELPLYQPYRTYLKSKIADLSNAALSAKGGGAITAALFLESFIDPKIPWIHFDLFASNPTSKPGRPEGGEAMGLRTVFNYLVEKYGRVQK